MLAMADAGDTMRAGIPVIERLISLGCALQNMLLAAQSMGSGSGLTSGAALESQRLRERAAPLKRSKRELALQAPGGRASAAFTRSGVNGTSRRRTPVASNTALPIAAGIAHGVGSPAAKVG